MNPQSLVNDETFINDRRCKEDVAKKAELLLNNITPKLLKKTAGDTSCCIFKIPYSLLQLNLEAYEPKIVSIGPYHHGKECLQMIQEHKPRFLQLFLDETKNHEVSLSDLVNVVLDLEKDIRSSYSEDLDKLSQQELVDMMLLDGCFILTLFLVFAERITNTEFNDPFFRNVWILPIIQIDLLRLENQLPYFLLQNLLKTSKICPISDLNTIAYDFFYCSIPKTKASWERNKTIEAKHLLDLIRKSFLPISTQETPKDDDYSEENYEISIETSTHPFLGLILAAKTLRRSGIKFFVKRDGDTLLDITLCNKNQLHIPVLPFDDIIAAILVNCVAFEQFYAKCPNYITSYVVFMGCLMNDEEDVAFLRRKGIVESFSGARDHGVSGFFRNIRRDVVIILSDSYLGDVFGGINEYTSKGYHVQLAEFKHTHFESPWTCLSSSAALLLLVLTFLQTYFTAMN